MFYHHKKIRMAFFIAKFSCSRVFKEYHHIHLNSNRIINWDKYANKQKTFATYRVLQKINRFSIMFSAPIIITPLEVGVYWILQQGVATM